MPPEGERDKDGDVLYRAKMSENRRFSVKIVIAVPSGTGTEGQHPSQKDQQTKAATTPSSREPPQPVGCVVAFNPYFITAAIESGAQIIYSVLWLRYYAKKNNSK